MSKFILVDLFSPGGGEYTSGTVSDKKEIEILKENFIKNKNCSGSVYYTDDDGEERSFENFEHDNKLHVYGPDVNGAQISICYANDSFEPLDYDDYILESKDLATETSCIAFNSANPFYESKDFKGLSDNVLIWTNYKIEKRIHFPALIKLHDDEEFNISNLFIGSTNLDKIICCDEIIDTVLYIRPKEQIELGKKILGEDFNEKDFNFKDLILDFMEYSSYFYDYLCQDGDIYGKGEWENDFNAISDKNGNVLFSCGEY